MTRIYCRKDISSVEKMSGHFISPSFLILSVLIFLLTDNSISAQAVNDSLSLRTHELGDVFVISGMSQVEKLRASRVIAFLSSENIRMSAANDVAKLLKSVAGVDVRERGPAGAQADIGIRGGTFDQTLVLLNGINITDPQTGHNSLILPFDPGSIDRIEVLQGPSSKMFGANAFSGAVNIVTGNGTKNRLRAAVKTGQYGLQSQSVSASLITGSLSQLINAHRLSHNGYISNTDLTNAGLFYQVSHNSKKLSSELQAGYSKKQFGANSFYSLRFPEQFESLKSGIVSLKIQTSGKIKTSQTFYLRHNSDRFELIRNNDSIPFNHHRTVISGTNLTFSTGGLNSRSTIAIDLRNEAILSSVLGIPARRVEVKGFDDDFYTKRYNRLVYSFYAGHNLALGNFTADAGVLLTQVNSLKGLKPYPGLDMAYRLTKSLKLYAAVNKTLRLPTFTDLFYRSPIQRGNSKLKPEEAWTAEGGLKTNSKSLSGSFTLFRRNGYNMIDWVKYPVPDSTIWRSMNYTSLRFTGMESSVVYFPSGGNGQNIIKSVSLSWSYLSADTTLNNLLSKYALDFLSGKVSCAADFRISQGISFSTALTWYNRNGEWQDKTGNINPYKPYVLLDAKIKWTGKWASIFVSGTNILNQSYYDFGGIIQPGVWMTAGVELDLDLNGNKKGTGDR